MRLQQVCDQDFPTKIDCHWWWLRYDDTEALIIFGNKRNQTNFLWWQGSVVFTFHSATGCAYYKAQPQSIHHNSQKWWISEVISITRLVCFRYDWRTREGRADAQGPVERSCRGNLAHRAYDRANVSFLIEKCKFTNRTTQLMPYNNEQLSGFFSI